MALYSSVNKRIYGHVAGVQGDGGGVGAASPHYIHWLCVTEEYILIYSSVTHNR
jgi:hypothetical protein